MKNLLYSAVKKREGKIGLLFSGGVDSTVIAKILKDKKIPFTCYVAGIDAKQKDVQYAKKIAKKLNLKLKIKTVSKIKSYLKKIVPLIEDCNPVQVGVALPIFVACQAAKKDKCKYIFTGMGADEIFGGYFRYNTSKNLKKECKQDVENLFGNDFLRDKKIVEHFKMKLETPYLNKKIISFGLKKCKKQKQFLRDFALEIGVPKESALRKKTAAQYGSGFDKTLAKIAKPLSKTQYLKSFYNIGAMLSSGKDGMFATHKMQQEGYNIAGIISIQSKNPYSYMFHTPNVELVKLQAKSMKLPLITQNTVGKKEKELKDLEKVLKKAKKKFNLQGIVTGALFSEYQKDRIEKICNKLNLKSFSPLWHMDQEKEMRELLKNFEIIFSSIAAYGLDKSWVGRKITEKDVDKLVKLHKKYQINIAGEGGEFESLVLNCPMFSKKIKIINSKIIEEDENNAKLIIKKAKLI